MAADPKILNEVRSLEAHFEVGLRRATKLRKQLEGSESKKTRGLSEEGKARIVAHRKETLLKNKF